MRYKNTNQRDDIIASVIGNWVSQIHTNNTKIPIIRPIRITVPKFTVVGIKESIKFQVDRLRTSERIKATIL